MYKALLKWHTRDTTPILHQEILDDAKNRVEAFTGLRPTNERLLKGVKILGVPPRIKDHLRCLLTSKLKCGSFWNRIPGCAERAMCSPCRKRGTVVMESEQHMWLDCEHNRQALAWEIARKVWYKSTDRRWPDISTGLIRGIPALSFEHDYTKDSERLRILIALTIWAIWKTRNKFAITDQDIAPTEARETLKELLSDLVRRSWNATRFMEYGRRADRQRDLRTLWVDEKLEVFDPKAGPTVDFS